MVGRVGQLWRFPVKSFGGEQLDAVAVSGAGLDGDRGWGLVDDATGKVVSAKSLRDFPGVLALQASGAGDAVQVVLPDGATFVAGDPAADAALTAHFGRAVHLQAAAPDDFTIASTEPDLDAGADTEHDQKLGAALFRDLGVPSPVPEGAFFDVFPVSVITTATLHRLAALAPDSSFDPRRFRMNLVLATSGEGFPENDWLERELRVGPELRLRVAMRDPRCVLTTLAQPGLAEDREVLRTLVAHNRVEVAGLGARPCAGVYVVVEQPGTVRVGDAVELV